MGGKRWYYFCVMKKLLLITTPLLLVACDHTKSPAPAQATTQPVQSVQTSLLRETPRQGQYIALPGQAPVDTDAAFDQQVAAYANTPAVPTPTVPQTGIVAPQLPTVESAIGATPVAPIPQPTGAGVVVNPVPSQTAGVAAPAYDAVGAQAVNTVASGAAALTGAAMDMVQPTDNTPTGALVDYTLRITNATPGRVFIEAQDAAGEIYPCGFMTGSQSISSVKTQVAPIKGPITVVVRDPDKPEAPEIRRYKVTPPTGYAGKTVEITIISGGMYQVSVDGQVRYITPTPVGKPDLGNAASTPAAAATPETPAASAPASTPEPAGPAPEQTPAGM